MAVKSGLQALEAWGRKVTKGYRDVNIQDLTSSWRDGLAFCAIIHHFHPDLINYDSLSKENIIENNNLAFDIAFEKFSIPRLLDAEDMLHPNLDKRSISLYLSELYRCFEGKNSSHNRKNDKSNNNNNNSWNNNSSSNDTNSSTAAATAT